MPQVRTKVVAMPSITMIRDTAKVAGPEEKQMKRSFKMTTAFAGAVVATMGLGPAALAATARPASRTGSIKNQVCGANNGGVSNWLHLYYIHDDHPAECFANKGHTTASANIASTCAGNNTGNIAISSYPYNIHFNAGDGRQGVYGSYDHITAVSITGWTGNAKCIG
jgi:hypothetical protein